MNIRSKLLDLNGGLEASPSITSLRILLALRSFVTSISNPTIYTSRLLRTLLRTSLMDVISVPQPRSNTEKYS